MPSAVIESARQQLTPQLKRQPSALLREFHRLVVDEKQKQHRKQLRGFRVRNTAVRHSAESGTACREKL